MSTNTQDLKSDGPFYKWINVHKQHYDFTFQDGLNVDTNTFYPRVGSRGGFHFTNTHNILYFFANPRYLCIVTFPEDARIIKSIDSYSNHVVYKADKIILSGWYDVSQVKTWQWMKHSYMLHQRYVFEYCYLWAQRQQYTDVANYLHYEYTTWYERWQHRWQRVYSMLDRMSFMIHKDTANVIWSLSIFGIGVLIGRSK